LKVRLCVNPGDKRAKEEELGPLLGVPNNGGKKTSNRDNPAMRWAGGTESRGTPAKGSGSLLEAHVGKEKKRRRGKGSSVIQEGAPSISEVTLMGKGGKFVKSQATERAS